MHKRAPKKRDIFACGGKIYHFPAELRLGRITFNALSRMRMYVGVHAEQLESALSVECFFHRRVILVGVDARRRQQFHHIPDSF